MAIDPITTGKLAVDAASKIHGVVDSAAKPNGPVSRLLGLDLLGHEFRALSKELEKFVTVVEDHHRMHEKTNQTVGMLLSEFRHFQDRVTARIEAAAQLADARSAAQDQALRSFETHLSLMSKLVQERAER
jgi:hypothetical protein